MDLPEDLAVAYEAAMFGSEPPDLMHTSAEAFAYIVNKMTDITEDRRKELLDFAAACPTGCWIEMTKDAMRYVGEDNEA